jgi:hypothetical protein
MVLSEKNSLMKILIIFEIVGDSITPLSQVAKRLE